MASYIKLADGTIVEVGTAREYSPEEWTEYVNDLQEQANELQQDVLNLESQTPSQEEIKTLKEAYEEYNAILYVLQQKDSLNAKLAELQAKLDEVLSIG